MSIIKKIIRIFIHALTLLLFALLLFAIYGKVRTIVFKQSYTTLFGYTMFQVASGSMEPTLSVDDVIVVKVGGDFQIDDIVSYENNDAIITHRVLAIDGDNVTVKGDANNTIDSPVDRKAIIGRVIKILPELKIWQEILTDPKTLLFMFSTLLLFDFAFSYKRKDVKKGVVAGPSTEVSKVIEPQKNGKIVEEFSKVSEPQKNEKIVEEVPKVIEPKKNRNGAIASDELMLLTREINLNQVSDILKQSEEKRLNPESSQMHQEIKDMKLGRTQKIVLADLKEKKKEYTVRLDLKAIQKNISKKIE